MTNETHILNLHSQGLLNAEIARAVNVSQSLVYYYLHKHNLVRNEMDYVWKLCAAKEKELIRRSRDKKLPCDLNGDGRFLYWLLVTKQNYKCYSSGITMSLKSIEDPTKKRKRPDDYVWSVDRVRPEKGYTKKNIVIMSYIDNHDKWDRTLEQIKIWKPSLYKKFINDKDLNLYD